MDDIERRYMPFSDVENRILPLLGSFLAKKAGKAVAKKFGGAAVDLLAKNPTGAIIAKGLDDFGVLKAARRLQQGGGWQSSLIKKLDEPVFDLGGGRKITVGQVSRVECWAAALSPNFGNDREAPDEEVEEVPKLVRNDWSSYGR